MALTSTELTAFMQQALRQEWQATKGSVISNTTVEDMRLIFAAVARGLLNYLETHQDDFINTITVQERSGTQITQTVVRADFNINPSA
jgi:hypothetical protein